MKKFFLLLAVLALKPVLPVQGQSYNFTFRVPVELHLIPPEIKSFSISVSVYDRPYNGNYPWPGSRIGAGSTGIFLVNGEYNDTVTVAFNEDLRKDPFKAVYWDADLLLYGPVGYQGGCLIAMGSDTPYPYDPAKPLVCRVHGPIPPPAPVMKKIPAIEPFRILRKN